MLQAEKPRYTHICLVHCTLLCISGLLFLIVVYFHPTSQIRVTLYAPFIGFPYLKQSIRTSCIYYLWVVSCRDEYVDEEDK